MPPPPLAVLLVGPAPPPYGGMALQARALVERLKDDGFQAKLLPTNPPVPAAIGRLKGVRTLAQSILFLAQMIRALCSFRVVHLLAASHWYFVLRVAPTVILGRLFGRRVVVNYRGGEAPEFFKRFQWLVLPILRRADAIVVPSAYLQRIFESHGFRAAIIANFIDHDQFRYRHRDKLKPKLLVTRSLEPLYNVKMALEAFVIIQRKFPDATIEVVGGGSEEAALREWVQRRGLTAVRFHGAVPNEQIPAFLASADILLNPTNADNMPLNLLEAFAAGVPVVTTNVGGIPDLLGSVEAAMLVDPNDAAAMAEKVDELLCRPEIAARMTREARALCEQSSWSRVGRLWRDVYRPVPASARLTRFLRSTATSSDRSCFVIENSKSVEMNGARIPPNADLAVAIQGGLLLVLYLLIFAPTIPPLYNDWVTFDTFSHGLLVPFISGYLIWQKRATLLTVPLRPTFSGMLLIMPALVFALVGKAVGDAFTERIALVLCLAGIVWLVLGWEVFKRLSFPLGYLFLMIPFPYVVVKEVAYQLRIVDAALAAPALRVLGVPVYRESYYLHLPDITLEVADLCSGISSVFALLSLGAAYVYFLPLRPAWKTLAVLSTFPFAALINLFRIILTAALAYYVSPAVLGVLVHKFTGTITFFIALFLFIALVEFLQRRFLTKMTPRASLAPNDLKQESLSVTHGSAKKSWLPAICGMAVLVPAVYFSFNLHARAQVRLPADLDKVPLHLANFQASENATTRSYRDPNAEKELSRIYLTPSGDPVEMYVGFREVQHGDKRMGSPKLQFPYGWNYVWTEPAQLANGASGSINVNWMLTQNNQVRVLVLYWYQARGQTIAGETQNRLSQIRGAIFDRRTDGAVVRLATPVVDLDKIDQAKSRLAAFASVVYPVLRDVLPQ